MFANGKCFKMMEKPGEERGKMRRVYCLFIALIVFSLAFAQLAVEIHMDVWAPRPADDAERAADKQSAPITSTPVPSDEAEGESAFSSALAGRGLSPSNARSRDGSNSTTTSVRSKQPNVAITPAGEASAETTPPHASRIVGGMPGPMAFSIIRYPSEWIFLGAPNINGAPYPGVEQIVVDAQDQHILYVTVNQVGLFTSRDGGVSWELAVPGAHAGVIAADPNTVERIFYGQHNYLYVSTDRGRTWDLQYTFDPAFYFISLIVSKLDPHRIYAGPTGTNGTFYRSLNDGISWDGYSFGETIGLNNFIPWTIAEDAIDGTLYAGVELGNHPQPYHPPFLRSMDGGVTWENLVENMSSIFEGPVWHATSIVVHPEDQKVYALSEGVGVYTSTNHGLTWTVTLKRELIGGLVLDPNREGRLFAGSVFYSSLPGGAYISTDDAESFIAFGLEGIATACFAFNSNSSILFAAAYGSGIYFKQLSVERPRSMRRSRQSKIHRNLH